MHSAFHAFSRKHCSPSHHHQSYSLGRRTVPKQAWFQLQIWVTALLLLRPLLGRKWFPPPITCCAPCALEHPVTGLLSQWDASHKQPCYSPARSSGLRCKGHLLSVFNSGVQGSAVSARCKYLDLGSGVGGAVFSTRLSPTQVTRDSCSTSNSDEWLSFRAQGTWQRGFPSWPHKVRVLADPTWHTLLCRGRLSKRTGKWVADKRTLLNLIRKDHQLWHHAWPGLVHLSPGPRSHLSHVSFWPQSTV